MFYWNWGKIKAKKDPKKVILHDPDPDKKNKLFFQMPPAQFRPELGLLRHQQPIENEQQLFVSQGKRGTSLNSFKQLKKKKLSKICHL